jgi:hypothetical protein
MLGVSILTCSLHEHGAEAPSLPVFPGAEGYGIGTPAGRGGQVIRVTSLNDAGPGSLRAAVLTTGPRTIIFDVSGTITLTEPITVGDATDTGHDFLTIAGQTAPSPGITIRGSLLIRANDMLIQHIRVRTGLGWGDGDESALRALGPRANRVIFDHVSTSWATDEGIGVDGFDVTVSNSINSEGIMLGPDGPGGKGFFTSDGNKRVAVLRNLLAHDFNRNPEVSGNTYVLWANNLIYDPGAPDRGYFGIWHDSHQTGQPSLCTLIGNVAKQGPSSAPTLYVIFHETLKPGSRCYAADNVFSGGLSFDGNTGMVMVSASPFPLPSPLTLLSSGALEPYIAANVGARPADRDPVDARIVDEMVTGTKLGPVSITDENEVGGFPTLAQNIRVLALPANPNGDDDGDGYTNLEELLHALAACVEGRSSNVAQCQAWSVIP